MRDRLTRTIQNCSLRVATSDQSETLCNILVYPKSKWNRKRNAYIFLKGVFFALMGQSSFEKRSKKGIVQIDLIFNFKT